MVDVVIHTPSGLEETTFELGPETAVIRTSDRMSFRNCRRKWSWTSHLKSNLEPKSAETPFWFGSGIHFAMEDMFGDRQFQRPQEAFEMYARILEAHSRQTLPLDFGEHRDLGLGMLTYFNDYWLRNRDPLTTYVVNGIPQVEVNFLIELPFNPQDHFPDSPYTRTVYSGTMDRVIVDEFDRLWIVDYKTAKQMKTTHFAQDSQISSYCWAASKVYGRPVAGLIYWQFLKVVPVPPAPLKSGKISTAQNQRTSRTLYKAALEDFYGPLDDGKVPAENIRFLNRLSMNESEDHDPFIRRDRIYKNESSLEAEGEKILLELEDILNPHLPLYPNPTFMCPHMCGFYEACVSMDDGSDWEDQVAADTQPRAKVDESWRKYLPQYIEMRDTGIDLKQKDFE